MLKIRFFVLYASLCLFTAGNLFCQQFWLRQNSPSTKLLTRSFFTDSLYGWVIGDSGTIVHTSNSGNNWVLQQSGIDDDALEDVFFLNRSYGWILSNDYLFNGTVILSTTNGGQNWIYSVFPDTALVFNTIYFLSAQTGFISGYSEKIFKTTNGGVNWFATSFDTASCFPGLKKNDFVFADNMNGFACGGIFDFQGLIWKTTDGGSNWISYCLSPEPMQEIKFLGGNRLIAMGGDYEFGAMQIQSTNAGANWVYENIECFGNATGFDFRTPAEVWAALSFSAYFAVNLDSMKPATRWECIQTPDNEFIYDVKFPTQFKGWCVGSHGSIFKYNTSVIGISGNSNITVKEFLLQQNYPNPFNPATNIKFQLPNLSNVRLAIYDMLGGEIEVLVNGELKPGAYSVEWNAADYPSGVYFCLLQADGRRISKKMVLIK
jgi:photosystem II stability/assembly factor-like uncharacterized protein